MKGWRRVALIVLLLLSLVVGTLGAILGTSSGLRFLVAQVDGMLPGRFEIAVIEGGLFGRLHLEDVTYRDQAAEFSVEQLTLRWLPQELLLGRFHLLELFVLAPRYKVLMPSSTSPGDEAAESRTLPDLAAPFEVRVDRLTIDGLEYTAGPDADPLVFDRLLLVVGWTDKGIDVSRLELEMPGIGATIAGTVDPRASYPLDLHTRLALSLPDLPKTEIQGRIHGDMKNLHLTQKSKGDVQALLTAAASDLLGALPFDARLDLDALRLASLSPDAEGRLVGRLSVKGDRQRLGATGQLRLEKAASWYAPWHADLQLGANLEKLRVAIDHLVVTRPKTPLEFAVTGTADADLNVDLKGRWKSLQWPPAGVAEVASETGTLGLKGGAKDYRLNLQARVAGKDIPEGDWEVAGQGTQDQFVVERLQGKTLGGTLNADGKLAWRPSLSWVAALKGSGLDPGVKYPDWLGRLDLAMSSRGALVNGKLNLTAVIEQLSGTLRERPVSGTGTVKLTGDELQLELVELVSGGASLSADGRLGSDSDLIWKVAIPDLADLLPGASGTIDSNGRVRGSSSEPLIQGKLSAVGVQSEELAAEKLTADIRLDLSDATESLLKVQSQQFRFGEERIESLNARADGRQQQHRLVANLTHPMAELSLRLVGAYDAAKTAWQGTLKDLRVRSDDFGNWDLRSPAMLAAAPDLFELEELCLTREAGVVCGHGVSRAGKGNAQVQANGLQLRWLTPMLPPEVERLEGAVSLRADASLGEIPLADALITIEPGELAVHPPAEAVVRLRHQGGRVVAKYDEKKLAADFKLRFGQDGIQGRFELPRAPLDKDPLSAPLNGAMNVRFHQLQIFAGLLPFVQELNGAIVADLQLGGSLGGPTMLGNLNVNVPQLQIPDAGLVLEDIELRAHSDDGKHVHLNGGVTSRGRLVLEGDMVLDRERNWPTRMTLKGEKFRPLDLPEMNARMDVDLSFRRALDGMWLRGGVEIPKAYIAIDDVPEGAVTPSPDVVVETAGGEPQPNQGAPFAMQVQVGLGNDVQFRGFGLSGYFAGKVTVNQVPGEFPTASGELRIVEGTYDAYGQDLTIERGVLAYSGGRIDNPGLSLQATREADVDLGNGEQRVVAGVNVTGTAKRPAISVFSTPALEERDALSVILTGDVPRNLGKGGRSIDVGTAMLNKDLSVGARFDPTTSKPEIVTKYRINRKLHVEATSGADVNAADVFYTLDFD